MVSTLDAICSDRFLHCIIRHFVLDQFCLIVNSHDREIEICSDTMGSEIGTMLGYSYFPLDLLRWNILSLMQQREDVVLYVNVVFNIKFGLLLVIFDILYYFYFVVP